jgi:hypothetical protein
MPWLNRKPIVIEISKLTDEMISWYQSVGGKSFQEEHYDYRGNPKQTTFVGYGRGKYCHHRKDGTGGVRLHFNEEDANIATLFIMKFTEHVEAHNIVQEHFS